MHVTSSAKEKVHWIKLRLLASLANHEHISSKSVSINDLNIKKKKDLDNTKYLQT